MAFLGKQCSKEDCQYAFAFQSDLPQLLPPFLIAAGVEKTDIPVEIKNKSFDPEQNVILLTTALAHEKESLSFLFPDCARTYYRVPTDDAATLP